MGSCVKKVIKNVCRRVTKIVTLVVLGLLYKSVVLGYTFLFFVLTKFFYRYT